MRLCAVVFTALALAAGVVVTNHIDDSYESHVYDYYYAAYDGYSSEDPTIGCPEDSTDLASMLEDVCDVLISGVDKVADKLSAGIDGFYEVERCMNGRPTFLRRGSSETESRRLWFSRAFGDWELSSGSQVDQLDTILYGGDGGEEPRPELVARNKWNLAAQYSSSADAADGGYIPVDVVVRCVNHKRPGPVDYLSPSSLVQWAVQFFRR